YRIPQTWERLYHKLSNKANAISLIQRSCRNTNRAYYMSRRRKPLHHILSGEAIIKRKSIMNNPPHSPINKNKQKASKRKPPTHLDNKLREEREKRIDLTRKELADKIGASPDSIED